MNEFEQHDGVVNQSLLLSTFPTPESNLGLHCRQMDSLPSEPPRKFNLYIKNV